MPARTSTGDRPLLDLPAVAERLDVNHRYIRGLVAERHIPFVKLGHTSCASIQPKSRPDSTPLDGAERVSRQARWTRRAELRKRAPRR